MTPHEAAVALLPRHWSPVQALAVFECLHALREALWMVYGTQAQQARRDHLLPEQEFPEFDPDVPF